MEEQGNSTDMVTGMLQVFSTSVYALLDPGSMLSFVTPLLALNFEMLPEVLHYPIVVSTPLEENVGTDRVNRDWPIVVSGKTMCADLVELPMHDFDVTLGMDCLYSCYSCMDCHSTFFLFHFPNEEDLVLEGYNSSHLVSFNDLDHDIPSIDPVPIVNEFHDAFHDDLPGVRPTRDSDFGCGGDCRKTDSITNWTKPLTPTDIHSFLGLAGYYYRFVEDFSSIAAPSTALAKKNSKF
ncbi:uncharacterized protein [Solanum lycopersicum]|uniref:uncharacterized protein n=1 Tax=Solanum lycopersicum TaxID=4081 RepID=UPI003747ED01